MPPKPWVVCLLNRSHYLKFPSTCLSCFQLNSCDVTQQLRDAAWHEANDGKVGREYKRLDVRVRLLSEIFEVTYACLMTPPPHTHTHSSMFLSCFACFLSFFAYFVYPITVGSNSRVLWRKWVSHITRVSCSYRRTNSSACDYYSLSSYDGKDNECPHASAAFYDSRSNPKIVQHSQHDLHSGSLRAFS